MEAVKSHSYYARRYLTGPKAGKKFSQYTEESSPGCSELLRLLLLILYLQVDICNITPILENRIVKGTGQRHKRKVTVSVLLSMHTV